MVKAELGNIPQILAILVEQGKITANQQQDVLSKLNDKEYNPKKLFAGQMAVKLGYVTNQEVAHGLREQSIKMVKAAVNDIQTIVAGERLEFPEWMKPHWGNIDVNAPVKNVSQYDAASAAANVAKLIVQLANQRPEIAKTVQQGVIAAKNLTLGFIKGSSKEVPFNERAVGWLISAEQSLRKASVANNIDSNLHETYIEKRLGDVELGLAAYRGVKANKTAERNQSR